jgi:dienelactone hydrolase
MCSFTLRCMEPRDLRLRLSALVGFEAPRYPAPALTVIDERRRDSYTEQLVSYQSDGEPVPALLLIPGRPCGAGIVVHHQHHSQWHLGKSEVAGLHGDRWQAFGPALARRGVSVLAPDAIGFEDRRQGGPGTDARPSDPAHYFTTMCYRLIRGRPLMGTVLTDAATAHSVLAARDEVDPNRVGALGHSMGGASALFHAALDTRVRFAVVSGAACTYRHRMERGTEIEATQVVPGMLELCDLDDIAGLVAPRPLLLCSAEEDEYSHDAPAIADAAAAVYRSAEAPGALSHARFEGAHALTGERFSVIVDWLASRVGA